MRDYEELVNSLKNCINIPCNEEKKEKCLAGKERDCRRELMAIAADAIEELSKERIKGNCQTCAKSSDMCGDNTTRCPIEEHYALLLDGYCHLYEPQKEDDT